MATLINGNGNPRIYAAQDADLIAALAGDITGIAQIGNKFAATAVDANTISVADGVIVTKEGRRIQLDAGSTDMFVIPTGTTGVTNYYIIGYKLTTQSDDSQIAETFVQLMSSSSETITEDTFREGATDVYVSLYRVQQNGVNLGTITGLLPELTNISELKSDLADINTYEENGGILEAKGRAPSDNLNLAVVPGIYSCGPTSLNIPYQTYGVLKVYGVGNSFNGASWLWQEFQSTAENEIWVRKSINQSSPSWTNWLKLYPAENGGVQIINSQYGAVYQRIGNIVQVQVQFGPDPIRVPDLLIGTLPDEVRPKMDVYVRNGFDNQSGYIQIGSDGNVYIRANNKAQPSGDNWFYLNYGHFYISYPIN